MSETTSSSSNMISSSMVKTYDSEDDAEDYSEVE